MRARYLLPLCVGASLLLAACGNKGDSGANDVQHDWTALTTALNGYLGDGDNQVEGYSFALKLDGETVYTRAAGNVTGTNLPMNLRSEEHTSELQSLMRTSYAVLCLKKKKSTTSRQRKQDHQ